ncbi:hypothetical protein NIES267_12220 [Calothrix parasitica NIES-267]|uniref:Uncharacterized protein n=1 Tax=Calothrix parasitica NIES-267 TaxID=1973488 RepID=A0A1Z4LKK9_9CYAN|nr:hypothetical protein NIES267_12220 [Calothrix parasitica NIES-267]
MIPLIISFNIENNWKKNKIIKLKSWNNTSNEKSEQSNKLAPEKQFYMLNMFATVIACNVFYSFKIPIPSMKFLFAFSILSILCGIYLLYIRINFKYKE